MSLVGAEYADDAPDAVAALSAYFTNPGETAAQREANRRQAQEGMDALLALSGVSVTCATLSSRPKYKSPSCPGATGAFDLIGCQYNYDDSVAVRKRGKVRVVFYREGYRGQHQHAIASRRYLCSDSGDRGDLQSWFSTPAFRHLCRREDWDIPYQTSNYTCQ